MNTANQIVNDSYPQSNNYPNTLSYKAKQRQKAYVDFVQGFKMWRVWMLLAWQDINIRYRRSVLGPLWITLSMAITVYSMGFLYARLFHMSLETYFPYLVSGMLGWGLIQSIISEGVDIFVSSASLIRQVKLPYMFHIHRMCIRNFIVAGHNILVMFPIYLFFKIPFQWTLLPVWIFNVLVVYFSATLFANILGLICARYRDMGQIVKSILQVLFFLTPVMWNPSLLSPQYQKWVLLSPIYDFIELIRQPMIGAYPSLEEYAMVAVFTLLGIGINILLFVRYRSRIVYWL